MVTINVNSNLNDNLLIIGAGEAGGRIAEEFYNQGFSNVIAINTAKVDLDGLNNLSEEKKLLISVTNGEGAGKDPSVVRKAIDMYYNDVTEFIKSKINGQESALICIGGGGGTGSGLGIVLAEIVNNLGINVGMIYTLPIKNESPLVFVNALQNLNEIYDNVKNAAISPFIIVDNNELYARYNSSVVNFWKPINNAIVQIIKNFNEYSKQTSKYISALDRKDLKKVLSVGGSCAIGNVEILNVDTSDSIMEKIQKCFFMSGFELSSFKSAGVIVTGSEETLASVESAQFLNTIFDKVALLGGGMFFRGVYAEPDVKFLKISVIFNGMTLPEERINDMIKDINVGYTKIKSQENRLDGVFFEVDKRISNAFSSGSNNDGPKKIVRNPTYGTSQQGGSSQQGGASQPTVRPTINIPGVRRKER